MGGHTRPRVTRMVTQGLGGAGLRSPMVTPGLGGAGTAQPNGHPGLARSRDSVAQCQAQKAPQATSSNELGAPRRQCSAKPRCCLILSENGQGGIDGGRHGTPTDRDPNGLGQLSEG